MAAKARRRTYTAEYKRRILKEADACTTPGAVGALLRREGLYSSHLVVWRRARGRGELTALAPKKRGRKPTPVDPRDRKVTELERQLAEMTGRAERAEALVDAQKLGGAARPAGGERAVMIALVEERRRSGRHRPAVRGPGAGPRDLLPAAGWPAAGAGGPRSGARPGRP